MYCLNCGRLISNREKFCPYCGFENKHYVNFENSNEDQEEIADENEKLHQDQDQEIIDDERIEKDESQQQALEHVQDTDYKNLEEISPDSTKDLVNENEYDSAFEIKENSIHDIQNVNPEASQIPADESLDDAINESTQNVSNNDISESQLPHTSTSEADQKVIKKKKTKKGLSITLGIIIIILIVFLTFLFMPTTQQTININDYISIDIEGYNSAAEANLQIDYQKLSKDYGLLLQKNYEYDLKNTSKYLQKIQNLFLDKSQTIDDRIGQDFFDDIIKYEFNKSNHLSNGDQIELKLIADEEKAKEKWQVQLQYKDLEQTVENLLEADVIDVFEQIDVVFSGYNGQGIVEYTKKTNYNLPEDIIFTYSPEQNLKNDDVIEVTVESKNGDINQSLLSNLGVKLAYENKTFVVEGLEEDPATTTQTTTEIPTEIPTEEPIEVEPTYYEVEYGQPGIIFPFSSESLIDESIIENLTDDEIKYAINEIYARHGFIFQSADTVNYYNQYEWYVAAVPGDLFDPGVFNAIESTNIDRLSIERNARYN